VVEIIFELEERFDIEIPFNANQGSAGAFGTVGEVIAAVDELVAAKAAS
jgi:acyl carrier protein